jgi:hypothetical protein
MIKNRQLKWDGCINVCDLCGLSAIVGRKTRWGGLVEEIRPGDVISIQPGEKHWHGATGTTAMTHIAIQSTAGPPTGWKRSAMNNTSWIKCQIRRNADDNVDER